MLRINYPKAIFFAILMAISLVGLLLLKYYHSFRVKLFYTEIEWGEVDQASHVFIKGTDKIE